MELILSLVVVIGGSACLLLFRRGKTRAAVAVAAISCFVVAASEFVDAEETITDIVAMLALGFCGVMLVAVYFLLSIQRRAGSSQHEDPE